MLGLLLLVVFGLDSIEISFTFLRFIYLFFTIFSMRFRLRFIFIFFGILIPLISIQFFFIHVFDRFVNV